VPPFLQFKPGLLEALLPGFWRVAVVVAGDVVKEAAVGVAQCGQPDAIKDAPDGKTAQEVLIGHAKIKRRPRF